MNKRTGMIMMMVAIFLIGGHTVVTAADNHGDDCITATPIQVDAVIGGRIEQKNLSVIGKTEEADIDVFRFTLPSSGILTTYTSYTEEATDTFGSLIDEQGSVIAQDDDSGRVYNFRIVREVLSGSYCVAVRHYESDDYPYYKSPGIGSGSYTLHVEFEPRGIAVTAVNEGHYGAVAVHENGDKIASLVTKDASGSMATRVVGAVRLSPSGDAFVVLNGADGLPRQAILQTDKGEYGFAFSNYTVDTVDVAMVTPGKSKSVYITRGIPVHADSLFQLKALAAHTNSGGTFTLYETIKVASPLLRLSSCAATAASGDSLIAELPCKSSLLDAVDLYLPQYERIVLSNPLFLHLAQCDSPDPGACQKGWTTLFDKKLSLFNGFWQEIVSEDWPVFDVLIDEGFALEYGFTPASPPPGINQDVLRGSHSFEYCQGIYSGNNCIKVKVFYDPASNINVITANAPLEHLSNTFLSEAYPYRNKQECRQTMRRYISEFEALVVSQGWKVKNRPEIDCSAFGN